MCVCVCFVNVITLFIHTLLEEFLWHLVHVDEWGQCPFSYMSLRGNFDDRVGEKMCQYDKRDRWAQGVLLAKCVGIVVSYRAFHLLYRGWTLLFCQRCSSISVESGCHGHLHVAEYHVPSHTDHSRYHRHLSGWRQEAAVTLACSLFFPSCCRICCYSIGCCCRVIEVVVVAIVFAVTVVVVDGMVWVVVTVECQLT